MPTPKIAAAVGADGGTSTPQGLGIAAPLRESALPVFAALAIPQQVTQNPLIAVATAASSSGVGKDVIGLAVTTALQIVVVTAIAAIPPSLNPPSQNLALNGYQLVPNGSETVTALYSRWTYLPGGPSLTQGEQQFDVVDPVTSETTGTFDALVSRARSFNYQSLLVTANNGGNVGADAGQVPPVGSLIANFKIGRATLSYSAMPTPSGDVVSCVLSTPFGDIAIPTQFNAAKGVADHTVDNRPVDLGDGYYIAPADPAGETFTAISGFLPLFTTVQGNQVFNVYSSAGEPVGSFEGQFTTTSDTLGTYTQAILVTSSDGPNVGTEVGQVPPVGSVYNVIYLKTDDNFYLYSSKPSQSGTVISLIKGADNQISDVGMTFMDASTHPTAEPLSAPTGHSFVAASPFVPSGVNGLPPREVSVQGYQQFDVYDQNGDNLGTVDAAVAEQWDPIGIHSQAILITDAPQGAVGTDGATVPPAGSVFDFVYFGSSGFGTSHATVPTENGSVISMNILTPLGQIPIYSVRQSAKGGPADTYSNPLTVV